jgi:hypothetical protein
MQIIFARVSKLAARISLYRRKRELRTPLHSAGHLFALRSMEWNATAWDQAKLITTMIENSIDALKKSKATIKFIVSEHHYY